MLKILVVEDHALVRAGLSRILSDALAPVTIGEAASAEELMLRIDQGWDLVLLDVTLPGRSGLDILRELKAAKPNLPVLMVTMHLEEPFAVRALRAGASGYLTKERAPEELIAAVRKVLSGGRYVTDRLADRLLAEVAAGHSGAPHDSLSAREFEVLRAIASGLTASQIAERLALSIKTVSTYRARILDKLKLATNAELTRYAMQNQLV